MPARTTGSMLGKFSLSRSSLRAERASSGRPKWTAAGAVIPSAGGIQARCLDMTSSWEPTRAYSFFLK
ncbi:hypothetical protein D3C83_231410 [compost metagenome]